jgi:bidirectional [NiFe] hydrogenase diaphorase subunit
VSEHQVARQSGAPAGSGAGGGTVAASEDPRFAALDDALARVEYAQDQLIELLHVAQDVFGYLTDEVLLHLARALRLPQSTVYGVATFYHLFVFAPPGAHSYTVCTGTACFVEGADDIVDAVSGAYGVPAGGTTPDGRLALTTGRCLGPCVLAPVVVLDGDYRGHETPESALAAVEQAVEERGADT